MSAPSIIEALEAFFEPSGEQDFGEWFESKLKHARAALDNLETRRKSGVDHKSAIIVALAKYDEADENKRVTSGETLSYWEKELADADEEISELIGDIDPVDLARHALFSPSL